MPSPVEVLFSSKGVKDVLADIGSVMKGLERLHGTSARSAERGARAQVTSSKNAAAEMGRIDKATHAARQREYDVMAKGIAKAEAEGVKATKKAADERIKATAKAHAEITRQQAAHARQHEQIVQNSLRMEQRNRDAATRAHEAHARSTGSRYGGAIGRGVGNVASAAGAVAGAVAAIGGGFTIADALGGRMREESTAGQIVRSAADKGGFNKGQVIDRARATAISTGGTTDDVLGGIDAFVMKTGDLGAGVNMIEKLSKVAAASGTALADMGSTAAEVFSAMEGTAEQKAAGTMKAILALAGQGQAGAIDIRNLGQYGARLTASAKRFKGDTGANIESLGAIAQLAKGGGGATDAAESTEAVARLADDMVEHADKFKALGHGGVNVFTDKKKQKLRGVEDIITESIVKSGGDLSKLSGMYGVRSMKGVEAARNAYAEAGGGSAGERAIRALFEKAKSVRMTEQQANAGTADKLTETQAKLNVAMIKVNEAFADKLAPMLPGLIDKFSQLAPALASLIGSLVEHPWIGLGAAVTASITKEIAGAALGKGVGDILSAIIGGGIGKGGIPAAQSMAGMGTAGKGVAALAAGAAGFAVGAALAEGVIDPTLTGRERGNRRADIEAGNLTSVAAAVRSGKIDSGTARKMLADSQAETEQASTNSGVVNAAGSLFSGNLSKQQESDALAHSAALRAAQADVVAALQQMAANIGAVAMTSSPANPNDPSRGPTP